jgi:prevent-host-death family protein
MMRMVNMLQAKSSLSRLVEAVERGQETEIIIARNGRPAARLVAVAAQSVAQRIGIAKGRFNVPDTIDDDEAAIAALFCRTGK